MRKVTRKDEMAIVGSRLLKDGERVLVGVGIPNLSANIAKRLHAPHLCLIYESGVIDARPSTLPQSIGDPALVRGALTTLPMGELFSQYLQTGWVDVGFLGGAQIDRRGNLNSTVIGDYDHPKVRLSGSGGAADIASFAKRTIVLMPQELSRFPHKVDFITSAGHPPVGRRQGAGPAAVVTDMGLFDFDETGDMRLTALYEGVRPEAVEERLGWPLIRMADLGVIPHPTQEELNVLDGLISEKGTTSPS